jgi:hypothetical protein
MDIGLGHLYNQSLVQPLVTDKLALLFVAWNILGRSSSIPRARRAFSVTAISLHRPPVALCCLPSGVCTHTGIVTSLPHLRHIVPA